MLVKIEISAETRDQADTILNDLLERRLVTGGQIIEAPARFRWKGEIVDLPYFTITSFSIEQHQTAIVKAVEQTAVEEVPMVAFFPFTGNLALDAWVHETITT